MATKILKKLTIREFIGSKSAILAYALTGKASPDAVTGSPIALMRVLGSVSGFKAGETDNGPYVVLLGDFQGTNLQTGEIIEGVTKCILPDMIGDAVASAIHGGAAQVDFAVELFVTFSEKAATMYEYSAKSLLKPETPKPIAALAARMAELGIEMTTPLQLAAPVLTDEQKAQQVASEKAADDAREATKKAADAATASTTTAATKTKETAKHK